MKIGVIGLSGMGIRHASVAKKSKFVRKVLGCDLSESARQNAARNGILSVPDLAALLAWKPDAVFVVTNATTHAAVIEPCLEAGVHVFTEKPMTTEIASARKLVALAKRNNLNFQVGFELRYCGMTRAMKAIVASGLVGRPINMSLVQISGGAKKEHYTKKRAGGIFYEKLCHQVDLFRFWFGEPRRVMAVAGPNALKQVEIPDNVLACLVFPGGRTGKITYFATRGAHIGGASDHGDRGHFYELTLTCTRGSLTYDEWAHDLSVVRFNHREDCKSELVERFSVKERYGEPAYDLKTEDNDFLSKIAAGKPPTFPAADALKTMEWVELAERSLVAGGKWIAAPKTMR